RRLWGKAVNKKVANKSKQRADQHRSKPKRKYATDFASQPFGAGFRNKMNRKFEVSTDETS
ncbi:hypothetical protein D030_3653B, partial [Vibrio parahaemolyticus AQ3810]